MRYIIKSGLDIVVLTSIILLTFAKCKDSKDAVVTKILEVQAENMNKQCPVTISNTIRLDSCKVNAGKILKTYYTIASLDADIFNIENFEKITKPGFILNIQTMPDLDKARESSVTFVYIYMNETGNTLGEIQITADDYNRPQDDVIKELNHTLAGDNLIEILKNSAISIKSQLPIDLDNTTRITDCNISGKTLEYTYQLINTEKSLFDTLTYQRIKRPEIKTQLISNSEVLKLLKLGVTYRYIYKDMEYKYLCTIDINPNDIKP